MVKQIKQKKQTKRKMKQLKQPIRVGLTSLDFILNRFNSPNFVPLSKLKGGNKN